MLFCHVFRLHSSAFLIFFCITIIENLHLPSAAPETDFQLLCIRIKLDGITGIGEAGKAEPSRLTNVFFWEMFPSTGRLTLRCECRERISFLPRNIEPWRDFLAGMFYSFLPISKERMEARLSSPEICKANLRSSEKSKDGFFRGAIRPIGRAA